MRVVRIDGQPADLGPGVAAAGVFPGTAAVGAQEGPAAVGVGPQPIGVARVDLEIDRPACTDPRRAPHVEAAVHSLPGVAAVVAAEDRLGTSGVGDVGLLGAELHRGDHLARQDRLPFLAAAFRQIDSGPLRIWVAARTRQQHPRFLGVHEQRAHVEVFEAVVHRLEALPAVGALQHADAPGDFLLRIGVGGLAVEDAGGEVDLVRLEGVDPDVAGEIVVVPDALPGEAAVGGLVDDPSDQVEGLPAHPAPPRPGRTGDLRRRVDDPPVARVDRESAEGDAHLLDNAGDAALPSLPPVVGSENAQLVLRADPDAIGIVGVDGEAEDGNGVVRQTLPHVDGGLAAGAAGRLPVDTAVVAAEYAGPGVGDEDDVGVVGADTDIVPQPAQGTAGGLPHEARIAQRQERRHGQVRRPHGSSPGQRNQDRLGRLSQAAALQSNQDRRNQAEAGRGDASQRHVRVLSTGVEGAADRFRRGKTRSANTSAGVRIPHCSDRIKPWENRADGSFEIPLRLPIAVAISAICIDFPTRPSTSGKGPGK